MPLSRGVVLKMRCGNAVPTPLTLLPLSGMTLFLKFVYRITATNVLYFCVDKFNRFVIDKMFSFINHAKILGGHPAHYQSTVGWSIAQNAMPG